MAIPMATCKVVVIATLIHTGRDRRLKTIGRFVRALAMDAITAAVPAGAGEIFAQALRLAAAAVALPAGDPADGTGRHKAKVAEHALGKCSNHPDGKEEDSVGEHPSQGDRGGQGELPAFVNYVLLRLELGIRLALGAERADIVRMVLRQGMVMVLSGIVIGLLASLAMSKLMSSLLYDVGAHDVRTIVMMPVVFLGIALLASYLPARRATKVDPVEALRGN